MSKFNTLENQSNKFKHIQLIKTQKKKKWTIAFLIVSFLLIALLTIFFSLQKNPSYKENSIVAKVNGEPIYAREFELMLTRVSEKVYEDFMNTYNIEITNDLWFKDFEGKVPNEVAKENALNELVKIKVQQILAYEKGFISSIGYFDFLKELEIENKSRLNDLKENIIIYGPKQYNEEDYFKYIFTIATSDLKEYLSKKELSISEDELLSLYQNDKDNYRIYDYLKIQKITMTLSEDNGTENNSNKEEIIKILNEVKNSLLEGEEFEKLSKLYADKIDISELEFSSESDEDDLFFGKDLLEEANKLLEGEFSDIIERDGEIAIIRCIKRDAVTYTPFEEVKGFIKDLYTDAAYEKYVNEMANSSKVDINEEIYQIINVN